MANPNWTNPEPTLSPQHWRRYGRHGLRHKSGVILRFLGPDPERSRNLCLKALNKLPRAKRVHVDHIDQL
jgi:hypothetical protein